MRRVYFFSRLCSWSFLFALICLLTSSCVGGVKKKQTRELHFISQLIPYSVHFRRTPVLGAAPYAGPGGVDYISERVPNAQFDCEPLASYFADLDLEKIRTCLAEIEDEVGISFRLIRAPSPWFSLERPGEAPECIRATLSALPVPREMIFEVMEKSRAVCYAARLPIEEDEFLGTKLPIARKILRIDLPLAEVPETDEETLLLLFSWSSAPFWITEPRSIPSVYVPDSLCDACMGRENRLRRLKSPNDHWP